LFLALNSSLTRGIGSNHWPLGNLSESAQLVARSKEIAMSKLREKAKAQTKQIVGQMIRDDKLVQEGKEQARNADKADDSADDALQRRSKRNRRAK
jgi:hypothetical protein